jgi:hypothetical protein
MQPYVRQYPLLIDFIAVGFIARIVFWAATDRKLDDALITVKFDKNLADGFGLVQQLRRRPRAGIHLGPVGPRPDAR